jgi:hypothetical protein
MTQFNWSFPLVTSLASTSAQAWAKEAIKFIELILFVFQTINYLEFGTQSKYGWD